jgi:hypothetical protein
MYDAAINQASLSVQDALQVAALSEDMHIADLSAAITRTDNPDLTYIYQQELAFSRNNLRALVQQLTALGGTYKPTYLSQQTYDSIIGSPMEPVPT